MTRVLDRADRDNCLRFLDRPSDVVIDHLHITGLEAVEATFWLPPEVSGTCAAPAPVHCTLGASGKIRRGHRHHPRDRRRTSSTSVGRLIRPCPESDDLGSAKLAWRNQQDQRRQRTETPAVAVRTVLPR